MGLLHDQMTKHMKIRGYSPKTIQTYTSCVRIFAHFFQKSPLLLESHHVEDFILYLRNKSASESTIRMYYESLKFFYGMHNQEGRLPKIKFILRKQILPVILSKNEVFSLLNSCYSLKFKTLFSLIYSAGLRISEAINLTVEDLDFDRKTIYIRNGKNGKDRYSLLGNQTSFLLFEYLQTYTPRSFLFYSQCESQPLSTDSIRKHFKHLVAASGIKKSVTVHTLRHCFATHLIEAGTNIFHVMKLMGHANIQTTMIYLHMTALETLKITSPIDLLGSNSERLHCGLQLPLFFRSA